MKRVKTAKQMGNPEDFARWIPVRLSFSLIRWIEKELSEGAKLALDGTE